LSIPASLAALVGEWSGTNRLWLSPEGPANVSKTTLSVALAASDQALVCRYTWSVNDAQEEGILLLSVGSDGASAHAAWIDSWHLADTLMDCHGQMGADGIVTVAGTYTAPPGPDWGWGISLEPRPDGGLRLIMRNISPEGRSALAVQADLVRGSRMA
jgi:Protein of unknown function (DUF1579)